MKNKQLVIAVSLVLASTFIQADEIYDYGEPSQEFQLEDAGGLGLGAIFGGLLGGPIGAIAGGAAGNMSVMAAKNEKELTRLNNELISTKTDLARLRHNNQSLVKKVNLQKTALNQQVPESYDFLSLNKGISMSVQFRHDSHLLEPLFVKQITDMAKSFSSVEKLHIHLSGHADRDGGDVYNQMLSEQRVKSVAKVLCRAGWPKQRMHITAHGESRPLSQSEDKQGYVFDRRVSVLLTTAGAGI